MSPSLSRLPLDRSVRAALQAALQLKLPPGQSPSIEAIETATGQLLHELGPQLIEDCIQGIEEDPKKGALLAAAGSPPASKRSPTARS